MKKKLDNTLKQQQNGDGSHPYFKKKFTLGQRAADNVAAWAGSWTFILSFCGIMVLWMLVNVLFVAFRWDPYPFILLNLTLSTLAALQAPIILMSQNRAAERDRLSAKYDYGVNRKAEREIRNIQDDLDEIKMMIRELERNKKQKWYD